MPWNVTNFDSTGKIKDARVGGSQAWAYPGIPYPTDNVPGAIMPTVPSGADTASFPYDPCTLAAPSHPANWPSAEQANYYYVDKYHGSATDTANSYGYPNQPRLSIPSGAYQSSALYVEIHGNNGGYTASSPDYDFGNITMSIAGASTIPVFWQGVDHPWVGSWINVEGSNIIIDQIHFQNNDGSPLIAHYDISGQYITIRNSEIRGTGGAITGGTGQIITLNGSEAAPCKFVVIYRCDIHDGGEWNVEHNKDIHALRPAYWNRYIWFIENEVYHVQGDCCQTGNSSNGSSDPAQRSHYIYLGGNHLYEAFENALDNKNSFHVILSSNEINDFGQGIGPGTAVIASNNDEGTYTGYHWQINNEIYNVTGGGIRHSGDQVGEKTYSVGNWLHDCDDAIQLADHSGVRDNDEWVIHNTITDCGDESLAFNRGNGTNLYIRANITYDSPGAHIEDNNDFTNSTLTYHMSYNSDESATNVNEADYDTANNNDIDTNPVFTAPGSGDFTLQAGSPAVDAMATRDAIFADFEALYGISIAEDINGNPIPATNADLGAYQRT